MPSQGPLSPGTTGGSAEVGSLGPWSDTANIAASDDSGATVTGAFGDTSRYLVATNFGFAIPSGATIDGILVEWEQRSNQENIIGDNSIRLRKGGVTSGDNKAVLGFWPTTDTYASYGASDDLWGETWTDSDINASDFGAVLSASFSGDATARVDHVRVTVYYTESPFDPATAWPSFIQAGRTHTREEIHRNKSYVVMPWAEPHQSSVCVGPQEFDSATSEGGGSLIAWNNPTLALNAGGGGADCTLLPLEQSEYLHITDGDFDALGVPAASTITAISVTVTRLENGAFESKTTDHTIRLIDSSGTRVGVNKSTSDLWPETATTVQYVWTLEELATAGITSTVVRSTGFGVAISAVNSGDKSNTPQVNYVQMIVCYNTDYAPTEIAPALTVSTQTKRTWTANRSCAINESLESTLWTEPTRASFINAQATIQPPAPVRGAKIFLPELSPPDAQYTHAFDVIAGQQVIQVQWPRNASQAFGVFEHGAIGFESYIVHRPRIVPPPRRVQSFVVLPEPLTGPTFPLFQPRQALPAPQRANVSRVHLPPLVDTTPIWASVTTNAGRISPARASKSYIAHVEDWHKPMPQVLVTTPRLRPAPAGKSAVVAPLDYPLTVLPGLVTARAVQSARYRPTQSTTPILEPTSTGIATIVLPPVIVRPFVLLHRGPASQVFFAPRDIDTSTHKDDRDSTGASSFGSTGTIVALGSRTSTGGTIGRTGTGRPPNP